MFTATLHNFNNFLKNLFDIVVIHELSTKIIHLMRDLFKREINKSLQIFLFTEHKYLLTEMIDLNIMCQVN